MGLPAAPHLPSYAGVKKLWVSGCTCGEDSSPGISFLWETRVYADTQASEKSAEGTGVPTVSDVRGLLSCHLALNIPHTVSSPP